MYKAFGIVNSSRNIHVKGLQDYRPIGAFSFLGRYRTIDFPISNLSNSGIDRIQVYLDSMPRSLVEHLGTGRHYNINSKSGRLQLLFPEEKPAIYNTDIAAYVENMEFIDQMHHPYVVIVPDYMIYTADFSQLIDAHIESEADITLLYHSVDNAKDSYLNCNILNLNRQKGVQSIERNHGNAKNRNIFMDTYIMKKELFVKLVKMASEVSSAYTLADIINELCDEMNVLGVPHKGFFASVTDFDSYYDANMALINLKNARSLFNPNWPIYTRTNNSSPSHYFTSAEVKNSVVSNGCSIEGTVENSIIGRGCVIHKGAVVRNSVILANVEIGKNVVVDNQVIDKHAKLLHVKELVSPEGTHGYVRRRDVL